MIDCEIFSVEYDYIATSIITDVYVSDAVKVVSLSENGDIDSYKCKGLWDTGATTSVISRKIVEKLRLPAVSKTQIFGVNGRFETTMHVIDLCLPNKHIVRRVSAVLGVLMSGIDVLIGMDIITKGDFSISNCNGRTLFSFRSYSEKERHKNSV